MKINEEALIERIETLTYGDTLNDVFHDLELAVLLDTAWDEYVDLIGIPLAKYLWDLLTQYAVYLATEEYPELWDIKEFGWHGDNLTPNEGAIEWQQAQQAKLNRKEAELAL